MQNAIETEIRFADRVRAIEWRDGVLYLLDQRFLPLETRYLDMRQAAAVAEAIRSMVVRGAPAIGIAAAYGVVLAARERYAESKATWRQDIESDLSMLIDARPTAVNLAWAIKRMRRAMETSSDDPVAALEYEAGQIHAEDVAANRRLAEFGAARFDQPVGVLTHCNTGSLATGGYGTALGVIRSAHAHARLRETFVTETRPWLQGSRLTMWELSQDAIPARLIADSAAAALMASGQVDWVVTGADRVAANGDVINKIGTYGLAVLARRHGIRFMVAAPISTIDPDTDSGADVSLEQRSADELLSFSGQAMAMPGAQAWNPVFDVTPAELVDVLVTEKGAVASPDGAKIRRLLEL